MADPKILIRRSSTPNKVPDTTHLQLGELAINTFDGKLYLERDQTSGSGIATVIAVNPWNVGLGTLAYDTYFTAGNVGINTTSPTQLLDVAGDIRLRGAIYDSNNTVGTANQVLVSRAGAGITWANLTTIPVGDANTLDGLDSTQFLRSDVADTKAGITTFSDDVILQSNLNVSGVSTFQDNVNVTANLAVDTNTLFVNSANNRIGIGTTNPAYQVEIENTGANALLVLDRTDGAACFIEGQATRSAFGSVNATPLALAYNSAAVVLVGASGSITVNPDGDGFTFPTVDGNANEILQTDGDGNLSFTSSVTFSELNVSGVSTFQGNVYLGDNDSLYFGDGNDLRIFSGGNNSFIQETSASGNLYIDSTNLVLRNGAGNETLANFFTDGAVELYYDNSKKFETTGYGVTVSGGAYISGVTTASSFVKEGGTSSQFLKADGSVDSNTYLTTEAQSLDGVLGLGNTSSLGMSVGVVTATAFVGDGSGIFNLPGATLGISTNTTNQAQIIPFAVSYGSTTGFGATDGLVFNPSTTRLGIGSDAPAYSLDVAGDINSSTDVKINGTGVLDTALALAIALG